VNKIYVADFSDNNVHHDIGNPLSRSLEPLYTVLLLTPEAFQLSSFGSPISSHGAFMASVLSHPTKIEAEIFCISHSLEKVIRQWVILDGYLGELLAEDFMDPTEYVKLLFDDENFTRSRKYFWAIGCLGEFGNSVADTVKQWDLYFEARIKPLLDDENLAEALDAASLVRLDDMTSEEHGLQRLEEFRALVRTVVNHRESLVDLQTQFRERLETVKSLRDGV
jgi:hypothetical protein